MASWLVLKVDEWTTARSMELKTASETSAEQSIAPTGTKPPERALDTVMMSGVMPNCSWQKKVPERPIPACTSSRTMSALCRRQSDWASCQNSSGARLTPLPWIGSAKNAATSPRRSSRARAWASPKGIMSAPGSNGPKPLRNSRPPLRASAPVVSPWKAWSQ